jgi:hypothetical protein
MKPHPHARWHRRLKVGVPRHHLMPGVNSSLQQRICGVNDLAGVLNDGIPQEQPHRH